MRCFADERLPDALSCSSECGERPALTREVRSACPLKGHHAYSAEILVDEDQHDNFYLQVHLDETWLDGAANAMEKLRNDQITLLQSNKTLLQGHQEDAAESFCMEIGDTMSPAGPLKGHQANCNVGGHEEVEGGQRLVVAAQLVLQDVALRVLPKRSCPKESCQVVHNKRRSCSTALLLLSGLYARN